MDAPVEGAAAPSADEHAPEGVVSSNGDEAVTDVATIGDVDAAPVKEEEPGATATSDDLAREEVSSDGREGVADGQEVAADGQAAADGQEVAAASQEAADGQEVAADVQEAAADGQEAAVDGQEAAADGQEAAADGQEAGVSSEELAVSGESIAAVEDAALVDRGHNGLPDGDKIGSAHEASPSGEQCSDASVVPAHSQSEGSPIVAAAPVKTRGSAQYPLAELTGSGELPYYTPAQVAQHSVVSDCWLSFLGKVIDISEFVRREQPELVQSIISAAGTDVSHWFSNDGELKTVYDVKSGLRRYQTPGDLPLLHAPPPHPDAAFDMSFGLPWWRQEKLIVGTLTQKTRKLRVVNMLLSSSHVIDVCAEQRIRDINDLYRSYNAHAGSYTWKKLNKQGKMEILDDNKTLQENGLPDMSKELAELLIDEAEYLPAVYLYFNDDLTKA